MIEYEKLKIAHKIMQESGKYFCEFEFGWSDHVMFTLYENEPGTPEFVFSKIDDLIEKLTELTQPAPKYKVGDTLWSHTDGILLNVTIHEIKHCDGNLQYITKSMGGWILDQEALYPTKEALIEDQIKYWTEMREPEECQHESDTFAYPSGSDEPLGWRDQIRCKCIKCGEFYR